MTTTLTTEHGHLLHRPSSSGLAFWGPGDSYRFLVTGAESGGAYFAMEAIVPPHLRRGVFQPTDQLIELLRRTS